MTREAKYPVQTTKKTLAILEELWRVEQAGVTTVAESLNLNKSVVHNHLRTLEEEGYVIPEDEQYRLGLKFFEIGETVRSDVDLFHTAKPEIDDLADQTGEIVSLATEERGKSIYLYQVAGDQAVDLRVSGTGTAELMHHTALGKAMLSFLSEDKVNEFVDCHGLPKHTDNTIDDREMLFEELRKTRERGFAIDDEESIEGLCCIGAPIRNNDGTVLGSVSISGPERRFNGERWQADLPDMLLDSINVIEINTQYS